MKAYLALTKPRITWLILMSTAVGFFFGARESEGLVLAWTLLGTGLLASGTATLNQWWEREADARMRRTRRRPLPSGEISPGRALAWGVALSGAGFSVLAAGANLLAALLGLFTLLSYLLAYTPLKRRSPQSTTVGAIPGAMPPMIGYAAAHGSLTTEAWILYAILFLWQFPHFYSIAWLYQDDYASAGIKMKPVVERSPEGTARLIFWSCLLLVPVSLAPSFFSMTGRLYLVGALVLGFGFMYSGLRAALERTLVQARGVLVASVVYLPILYALMLIDRRGL